jgi:hypothetical protein
VGGNVVKLRPFVNGFSGDIENNFRNAGFSVACATLLNWQ